MHLIGYARVSTADQDPSHPGGGARRGRLHRHPRREALRRSPATAGDELASILDFIRPGDTLVVHKLDRLGRSTRECSQSRPRARGAGRQPLGARAGDRHVRANGEDGADGVRDGETRWSSSFIKDRQRAGIEAAKAEGVYKGRPVKFDRARIVELRKSGMGATAIAKVVGCKRGAVYLALKAAAAA